MTQILCMFFNSWKGLIGLIDGLWNRTLLQIFHVQYEEFPHVVGRLFLRNSGTLRIGRNVTIHSAYRAVPIGGFDFTTLRVFSGGELVVGSGTGITNSTICCACRIEIGSDVFIGGGCRLYDTDFHSMLLEDRIAEAAGTCTKVRMSPVRIRDGVFLGAGTIVLKGVEIGERSVVGAGSVVTRSIPAREIWGGNPARFLRGLRPEELSRTISREQK